MWEKISKEQVRAARELVDPTLPHLLIDGNKGGPVSYEQLEKGLALSSERGDPRLKGSKVRIFMTSSGAGFSEVIESLETEMIFAAVPRETSLTFAEQLADLFYYVISSPCQDEDWVASEREHYSMGAKP